MMLAAFYLGSALIVTGLLGKSYYRWREAEVTVAGRWWGKFEKSQRRFR